MPRELLPNRRRAHHAELYCNGLGYTVSIGRYDDGRPAEVFIDCHKHGSPSDHLMRDAAVVLSIALQFAAPVETLRGGVTRESDDAPVSIIGAVLDLLAGEGGEPEDAEPPAPHAPGDADAAFAEAEA